ncbi:MAG TPA: FAD:protein FMN transferase [Kiritimatiellia bacterium]|nr:FAD:protein FMN transferase [Kiritimatiellia bacterium]
MIIQPRPFNLRKTLTVLSVLLVALYFYYQRPPPLRFWVFNGSTMGTSYTIKFTDNRLNQIEIRDLKISIDALLEEVNRQMSTYIPDSEISLFNAKKDTEPFSVSPGFARVTELAIELCRATGGAFDPTLDHLITAWGFGHKGPSREPDDKEIASILELIGCNTVSVVSGNVLQKSHSEVKLNLNAIAKGWGVDEVARFMEQAGITNYFVEIGGEVSAKGLSEKMRKWRVGIDRPVDGALPGEAYDLIVELDGKALASSGNYRNFVVTEDGRKIAHILDPRSGRTAFSQTVSVSVIAENCTVADALATALFVMGSEAGATWVDQQENIAAAFIDYQPDGTLKTIFSGGFESHLLDTGRR